MFKGKKVVHVVAVANDGVIGFDGGMPWHIPEELKNFRKLTMGHAVVMGRVTVESLPKPLYGRAVLGISNSVNEMEHQKTKCKFLGLKPALKKACEFADILLRDSFTVAGGATIYNATKYVVDEVYMTRIHGDFEGDTHYEMCNDMKFEGYFDKGQVMYCKKTMKPYRVTFEKYVRVPIDQRTHS